MKNILSLFILLLPVLVFSQIPNINPRNIRILYQTTGKGTIWHGSDTINYTPTSEGNAWIHLDTINKKLYGYMNNQWQLLNESITSAYSSNDTIYIQGLDTTYNVLITPDSLSYSSINQTLSIKNSNTISLLVNTDSTLTGSNINSSKLRVNNQHIPYFKDTLSILATKNDLQNYHPNINLTTTGTSGASTLIGNTLNIPIYANTNIYTNDGTLTGNRILDLSSNTLKIRKTSTSHIEFGDALSRYYKEIASIPYELSVDNIAILQQSGTKYTRIDLNSGEINLRAKNAVDSTLSDLRITEEGNVVIRKTSTLPATSLTGRSTGGFITGVNMGNGVTLSNNILSIDSSNIATVNYINMQLSKDTITNGTLTSGNFSLTYSLFGSGSVLLTNLSSGVYKITIPVNTEIKNIMFTGNSNTLNNFGELTFKFESNSIPYYFNVQMYDIDTGAFIDQHALGVNHTQNVTSTETTLFFPGMSLFGTTGFRIILR